MLLKEAV